MRKLTAFAIAAVAALAFAAPAGATIINLDGVTNAGNNDSNAKVVHLAAGTYNVTFTQGDYTAFRRWNSNSECDAAGTHCRRGWENSAVIEVGSQTFYFGDGSAHGGYGPLPEGGYFASQTQSLTHAAMYTQQFTLASAADVGFYISDNRLSDNHGGVSLAVVTVPVAEPATWPLLLVGFGMLGLLAWRRREAGQA